MKFVRQSVVKTANKHFHEDAFTGSQVFPFRRRDRHEENKQLSFAIINANKTI